MRIVFISDMDFRGSGYFSIACKLCDGLTKRGHEVKVIGLQYGGDEHFWDFSILPAANLQEVIACFHNIFYIFKPDAVVVALDIPLQRQMLQSFQRYPVPYIVITPLESGPLCMPWAMALMQAKEILFISQHATDAALEKGLPAEHLCIGVDCESWRGPEEDERKQIRNILGIQEDEFAILTVADNQERKNPSRALEIVAEFGRRVTNKFQYIMVTREHHPVGMELRDYARDLGIHDRIQIYERGIPFKELWAIYAAADCFLLASKAEGLGMPVLEAMAAGLPVVGTRTGAITEHLQDGRGWLIETDYEFTDMFGNGRRYFANIQSGAKCLESVYRGVDVDAAVKKARQYVQGRTWDAAVYHLERVIQRSIHVQETSQTTDKE